PSATSRFWRLSSTIRTLIGFSTDVTDTLLLSVRMFGIEVRLDRRAERARVDRLRQITLEPDAEQALAVARHRQRRHRDDRQVVHVAAPADLPDDGLTAAARDLHVEQQQVGPERCQRATRLLDRRRLADRVPPQLEHVVNEQPVELVVLDDEDAGGRSGALGG